MADAGGSVRQSLLAAAACPPSTQTWVRRGTARQRSRLILILLLAFALRVFHLDTQSIWYDEGLSLYLAQQPLAQNIALSATTDHPPLHTLLLGGWLAFTGDSDFAVRFFSVILGVLLVALTFALGRAIDERAGLIAAGLLAVSPFAVYYSQEARDYALLTALTLTATLAFVRLLRGERRWRNGLAYVGAMIAALYTHYFAAFAWAAINVAWLALFVWSALKRSNREAAKPSSNLTSDKLRVTASWRLIDWSVTQVIILLAFLPWLPNALAQAGSNATYFPGRVTWQTVVGDTWRAFTVGEWGDASVIGWVWLALIVIGLVGVIIRRRDAEHTEKREVIWLLLSLVIVPLILMSGLAWLKPKFAPRYLLPSLPAVIVLASAGIAALIDGLRARYCQPASIGLALSLALPLASAASLLPLYADPALARPDVRSVAGYIQTHELAGDAIILIGGHQLPAFTHYYRGANSIVPLPPDLLPAAQAPLDARALATLADLATRHSRVWLVLWQSEISDPTNVIGDALLNKAKRLAVGESFHAMSVLLFEVTGTAFDSTPQNPVDFAFAQPLRLAGYNVNSTRITIDTPLRFGLYLRAEDRVSGNYQIFTHVLAADGSLVAQADHIAGADSYPTSLWQPGSLIYNRFAIQLPADTPPGQYQIAVGLYEGDRRLALADGRDRIDLFSITVAP